VTGLDHLDQGQDQHRPRNVVEGGLGDHRLGDLRPQAEPLEEGDEDGRVGRGEHRADHERHKQAHPEYRGDDRGDDEGGYEDARQDEQAETDGGTRDHAQRDAHPAVKEDHGHPHREDELGAYPLQRVGDDAEHRGADESPHCHEHDHLGYPQERRDELREKTSAEYEAEGK
jgi:hypothetical protein